MFCYISIECKRGMVHGLSGNCQLSWIRIWVSKVLFIKHVFYSGRHASATQKATGAIPKARAGRRHSVQVSSLSKDIEKLRLGEKKEGESKNVDKDAPPPGSGMSESRKKELRKMSSKRRSSKQGHRISGKYYLFLNFIHFRVSSLPWSGHCQLTDGCTVFLYFPLSVMKKSTVDELDKKQPSFYEIVMSITNQVIFWRRSSSIFTFIHIMDMRTSITWVLSLYMLYMLSFSCVWWACILYNVYYCSWNTYTNKQAEVLDPKIFLK